MEAVGTGASFRLFQLGLRKPSCDAAARVMPARVAMVNAFGDEGHLRYYGSTSMSCGLKKEEKRRKKMMKGLEKNLFALGELGFDIGEKSEVKGQINLEAADLLLSQLTKLRSEAKELKKRRKEEKAAMKAAAKAAKMKNCGDEGSSSSSESSDSECEPVVKMNSLKTTPNDPMKSESIPDSNPDLITAALQTENVTGEAKRSIMDASTCCASAPPLEKIEVCMGGKCKKSGAMELMAEFQKKIDAEGAVVGCKCMGKCRDGPNVRVVNQQGGDDGPSTVMTSRGPLCIGVGLEDVGSIVSNFFGGKNKDVGLLAA